MSKRALVVEDNNDIRELHVFFLESLFQVECVESDSGNSAIEILKKDKNFLFILCDYRMPDGNGGKVFQFLKENNIPIPYLLCSADKPSHLPEFKDALVSYAEKPNFRESLEIFVKGVLEREKNHGQNSQAPESASISLQKSAAAPAYQKIRVEVLISVNIMPLDVYIKIAEGKFLKVLSKGDSLSNEDLSKYKKKHIPYLYIEGQSTTQLLDSLFKSISQIEHVNRTNLDQHLKINEEVSNLFFDLSKDMGFTPETQGVAKKGVELALKTVSSSPSLRDLLSHVVLEKETFLISHSMALAYVACGIARAMQWNAEATHQKLALAAIIHDATLNTKELALYDSIAELEEANKKGAQYSQTQKEEFLNHPMKAGEIARAFSEVPPDVDNIVEQHHEKPDGTGFPSHFNHTKISPLSALFIIAHDIVSYKFSGQGQFDLGNFLKLNEQKYAFGAFKNIALTLSVNAASMF